MDAAALVRPVRDGLAQRIAASRGAAWGRHLDWDPDAELQSALGLDSIELLEAAEAASHMYLLERPGWEDYLLRDRSLRGWASVAAAAVAEHGLLRFDTSGSTGVPVSHLHALATLQAEAAFFAGHLAPTGTVRVAVPTHHIYGFLWGVLLPAACGAPVVDYCGRLPSTLLRDAAPGDVIVAHPLVWQTLAGRGAWPEGVTGVTSTAPCPPATIARLREDGLARMVEVYGSSETAGIGWRDAVDGPFALLPRWRLATADDGPALVDGDGACFALPDHVEVVDGGLRPVGRRDSAVQVAGHNVHPAAVADVLRAQSQVADAAVRLDSTTGRLKAFVVPAGDAEPDGDALRAACRAALGDAATPTRVRFGSALPVGLLGKAADWD